jgi:hypothetical protein
MKTDQQLDQAINNLPLEVQPSRDLWPELSARLAVTAQQQPEQPKRRYWPTIAAAVMLGLMWPLWQGMQADEEILASASQQAEPQVSQSSAPLPNLSPVASTLLIEFEREKSRQLAQVTMVPSEFADFQRQLDIWQQATAQVTLALEFQPDEPKLLKQLTRLQQQQIHYISRLVQFGQMS